MEDEDIAEATRNVRAGSVTVASVAAARDASSEANNAAEEAETAPADDAAAAPAAAATVSRLYRTTSFGLAASRFASVRDLSADEVSSDERGRGADAAFARTPARRLAPSSESTAGGVCGGARRGERRTGDAKLASDAVAPCVYADAAPTAAVRGGVALVALGGVSPLSWTFDKTSARSSMAFSVPGVRVGGRGGRAASTSSSGPLWRMKSMTNKVARESGGQRPRLWRRSRRPVMDGKPLVEASQMSFRC